jgi:hypothetical protein
LAVVLPRNTDARYTGTMDQHSTLLVFAPRMGAEAGVNLGNANESHITTSPLSKAVVGVGKVVVDSKRQYGVIPLTDVNTVCIVMGAPAWSVVKHWYGSKMSESVTR